MVSGVWSVNGTTVSVGSVVSASAPYHVWENSRMLSFTVDRKRYSIESDKPFLKADRLRQIAGSEDGESLWVEALDSEGRDTLVEVETNVFFPDGKDFYTHEYAFGD